MTEVEILLVENSSRNAEMTLRALDKRNPANRVVHVQDVVEMVPVIEHSSRLGGVVGAPGSHTFQWQFTDCRDFRDRCMGISGASRFAGGTSRTAVPTAIGQPPGLSPPAA